MKGHGGGSLYKRPETRCWWLKWYDANGQPHRASSGTEDMKIAKALLAIKVAAVAKGEPVVTRRIRVDDLLTDVENDYRVNDQALRPIKKSLERLRAFFGRRHASEVTTDAIRA